ncbi:helix-turn-helix domain-containing protein [Adhaeribacter radiodurans]|uniref:Helix-turn-helix domain-containing protein n=1 Tax=Adhaeribacter radiodurans TaxID=2745197 RepID=A0A7L7LDT9_9BACT|nr:helix-turn-helix domain-containing protein [Adhaeribacter radiodurans]QMU30579.1 helix-turn-helix domain-containing protein [Adhaeribacter radiodurans]
MEQLILIPLRLKDFKQIIKDCIAETSLIQPQQEKEIPNDKLTQKEAASQLGISEATLIDWKKKGLIPYHQLPKTRRVFFLKSELKLVTSQNPQLLKAARR